MLSSVDIYEIENPNVRHGTLDQQIDSGMNYWKAQCMQYSAVGKTEQEATDKLNAILKGVK